MDIDIEPVIRIKPKSTTFEYVLSIYEDMVDEGLYTNSTDELLVELARNSRSFPVHYIDIDYDTEEKIEKEGLLVFFFHNFISDEILDYKSALAEKSWKLEEKFMEFFMSEQLGVYYEFIECNSELDLKRNIEECKKNFFKEVDFEEDPFDISALTEEEKNYLIEIKCQIEESVKEQAILEFSEKFNWSKLAVNVFLHNLKPRDFLHIV